MDDRSISLMIGLILAYAVARPRISYLLHPRVRAHTHTHMYVCLSLSLSLSLSVCLSVSVSICVYTVSDMEGEVSSPSLALGADSDMKASIFNRRKAQTSECTLANTTTLSAIEGAPAQVSQVDKSALLQRRQSQRSATADASSAPTTNNPAAPSDVALAAPAQAPAAPAPAAASAPAAAAPAAGDDSALDPGDDSTPGQVPVDQARGSKGGGGKKKKKR
jgi:hypothetical protein